MLRDQLFLRFEGLEQDVDLRGVYIVLAAGHQVPLQTLEAGRSINEALAALQASPGLGCATLPEPATLHTLSIIPHHKLPSNTIPITTLDIHRVMAMVHSHYTMYVAHGVIGHVAM